MSQNSSKSSQVERVLAPTAVAPDVLGELRSDAHSRRAFLARMGAAGLGLAAVSLLGTGCGGGSSNRGGDSDFPSNLGIPGRNDDQRVLNYALTLEILEADLYRQALNLASGRSASAALESSPGAYSLQVSSGGLDNFETQAGFAYLRDFAFVEAAHRDFLRAALSGKPTVQPNPNGYRFAGPVNSDLRSLLEAILPLEETGVRAYLGAVPFVDSYKTIGQTAVSIYSTEARHSAAIRYILDLPVGPVFQSGDQRVTPNYPNENTFEYFLSPQQVVQAIQPFLVP